MCGKHFLQLDSQVVEAYSSLFTLGCVWVVLASGEKEKRKTPGSMPSRLRIFLGVDPTSCTFEPWGGVSSGRRMVSAGLLRTDQKTTGNSCL